MGDFLADVASKGLAATSGAEELITAFNARTFLQPQLQKACKAADKKVKGDVNPKDFLLFPAAAFSVAAYGADNTTRRAWSESVIPSLDWPSDHGLLFSTILPLEPSD